MRGECGMVKGTVLGVGVADFWVRLVSMLSILLAIFIEILVIFVNLSPFWSLCKLHQSNCHSYHHHCHSQKPTSRGPYLPTY